MRLNLMIYCGFYNFQCTVQINSGVDKLMLLDGVKCVVTVVKYS